MTKKEKVDFTLLLKKVREDIRNNPDKIDQYMAILAKHGLLRKGSTVKLNKCSLQLMEDFEEAGIAIKII